MVARIQSTAQISPGSNRPLHSRVTALPRLRRQGLRVAVLFCLSWFLGESGLRATPYATELANHGSSVSFRLNEAADDVRIRSGDGGFVYDLGPLGKGHHQIALSIGNPFFVVVSKSSAPGYLDGQTLQISDDADNAVKFWQPRGLAVNIHPASPYFGRVYVANAEPGMARGRMVGDGFYLLNADLTDAVGQGDEALQGNNNWSGVDTRSKPWKIEVGQDDYLYIADWTDQTGTIYIADPNVSPDWGTNVLAGLGLPGTPQNQFSTHGKIPSSVLAFGSLDDGTLSLYALEGDISPVNVVRRWDVGYGPLPSLATSTNQTDVALAQISGNTVDLDIGPDGKFYLLQNNFDGEVAGIFVADPALDNESQFGLGDGPNGQADIVYSSREDSTNHFGVTNDLLRACRAVKISPDGRQMAVVINDGRTWIVPLVNGIPDLAGRQLINTGNENFGRDVAFDAAGNLYVINDSLQLLRVFSPGRNSTATTGSDGTFTHTILEPQPTTVMISSPDAHIYERIAQDTATVVVTRSGPVVTGELLVNLQFAGSASPGVDYTPSSTVVVFTNAEPTQFITLHGLNNHLFEGDKTIIVSLAPGSGYDVAPHAALVTVVLHDDESPPGTVIFSDDFETDSSTNWVIRFGQDSAAAPPDDYTVEFAYNYNQEGIFPAPHSRGEDVRGLKVRVNKDATRSPATVNLYPLIPAIAGDFALRCDAYISVGTGTGGTTEQTLLGINHSGALTNRPGHPDSDGLWMAITGDAGEPAYTLYTGTNGLATQTRNADPDFLPFFTRPPWSFPGTPNNSIEVNSGLRSGAFWADLEIAQIGNLVTFKVNHILVFTETNSGRFASGLPMLGQNDPFSSIGSDYNYTIFDNVRVVTFDSAPVVITRIVVVGEQVLIDFEAAASDAPASFLLESAETAEGPYEPDLTAGFTARSPPGSGFFRATTPLAGATRFYYIQRR